MVALRWFCPTFKKIYFPMDFNDFLGQVGATSVVTWGLLWATFGSLWAYFGYLRVALGDFWVILGSLWRYDVCIGGLGGAVFDLVLAR